MPKTSARAVPPQKVWGNFDYFPWYPGTGKQLPPLKYVKSPDFKANTRVFRNLPLTQTIVKTFYQFTHATSTFSIFKHSKYCFYIQKIKRVKTTLVDVINNLLPPKDCRPRLRTTRDPLAMPLDWIYTLISFFEIFVYKTDDYLLFIQHTLLPDTSINVLLWNLNTFKISEIDKKRVFLMHFSSQVYRYIRW